MTDVIELCQKLISYNSVTPAKKDVFGFITEFLRNLNFDVKILPFQSDHDTIYNLFAKRGDPDKSLGFLGHIDVVPAGENWETDPFCGVVKNDSLIGRGVCDMKSGVAAFLSALTKTDGAFKIFITGDEEVGTYAGTQSLLKWVSENDSFPKCCLIGEPSSINRTGDRVYLGHRGSINVKVISHGKQGHVAFPAGFDNALAKLCKYVAKMKAYKWHDSDTRFPPTNLEPTMFFSRNLANNVVPENASTNINVRFSADHTFDTIKKVFQQENDDNLELRYLCDAEPYYCENEFLKSKVSNAITKVTGLVPEFSGAGGTSDGRFMKNYCDVIEFGVPDATMHQKNENVKISDIRDLEEIYIEFIRSFQ